ncbi:TAF4 [Candida oxycetoniae]|uniref:Transcription initiation factor TFIID subunit 4 n=1 Tax=Candida oxycetoniae TaxID=497107 RepID=A0AAI9SVV1_9ASCO|nr:TAF4 [Candida oxycetoniae]KAI3403465.2 TAF4 [Candida oxycetoniae]
MSTSSQGLDLKRSASQLDASSEPVKRLRFDETLSSNPSTPIDNDLQKTINILQNVPGANVLGSLDTNISSNDMSDTPSLNAVNGGGDNSSSNNNNNNNNKLSFEAKSGPLSDISMSTLKYDQQDSSKLNDAIAAAGVDIQKEEELLLQKQINRRADGMIEGLEMSVKSTASTPFLNPYHLSSFLGKVSRTHQINQNFLENGDILNLISNACEEWISHLASKALILSRHRRRGILFPSKKGQSSSSVQRSAVSKELRNIALRQKEMEEKRVQKRIMLGLEKSASESVGGENGDGKAGSEETLHRAANATAAMMSTGKKKYSWMNSSSNGGGALGGGIDSGTRGSFDSKSKQSPIISVRGDNGLRFREIRSANAIVLRDLISALEGEKKGTQQIVTKGYAKLRD